MFDPSVTSGSAAAASAPVVKPGVRRQTVMNPSLLKHFAAELQKGSPAEAGTGSTWADGITDLQSTVEEFGRKDFDVRDCTGQSHDPWVCFLL